MARKTTKNATAQTTTATATNGAGPWDAQRKDAEFTIKELLALSIPDKPVSKIAAEEYEKSSRITTTMASDVLRAVKALDTNPRYQLRALAIALQCTWSEVRAGLIENHETRVSASQRVNA